MFYGREMGELMKARLSWDDLLIEAAALDVRTLEHGWAWLLDWRDFHAIAASKFGDWFLARADDTVYMLDGIEGALVKVASSSQEFQALVNMREKQEQWLLSELVLTLHEEGVVPAAGQCYSFKLPLVLGGKAESSNVELCDLQVWMSLCGQIHQQTQALPEGARISGFRVAE